MRSLAVPGDLGRPGVAWGLGTQLRRVKSEKTANREGKAGERVAKPGWGAGLGPARSPTLEERRTSSLEGGLVAGREETSQKSHQVPSATGPTSSHQSLGHQGRGPNNTVCLSDLCFPKDNQTVGPEECLLKRREWRFWKLTDWRLPASQPGPLPPAHPATYLPVSTYLPTPCASTTLLPATRSPTQPTELHLSTCHGPGPVRGARNLSS